MNFERFADLVAFRQQQGPGVHHHRHIGQQLIGPLGTGHGARLVQATQSPGQVVQRQRVVRVHLQHLQESGLGDTEVAVLRRAATDVEHELHVLRMVARPGCRKALRGRLVGFQQGAVQPLGQRGGRLLADRRAVSGSGRRPGLAAGFDVAQQFVAGG